jgi:hypothetical protein
MDEQVAWEGLSTDLAFANIDSLDTPAGAGSGIRRPLGRRAGLVLRASAVIVAYEEQITSPGSPKHRTLRVPYVTGDLCADVLANEDVADELRTAVRRMTTPWTAWAQVFSPSMDILSRELERWGLDRRLLPSCSGVTVQHWNTKIGGGELLAHATPEHYPLTMVAGNWQEACALIASRPDQAWVTKPNDGMGGFGVRIWAAGERIDAEDDHLAAEGDHWFTKASAKGTWSGAPTAWIVQEVIGDQTANRSPSSDHLVSHDGTVQFVGLAEQVLHRNVEYAGSRSAETLPEATVAQIAHIGHEVGTTLHDRGYRGLFNLDHVLAPDGRLAVVEINVRQSAPLDQSIRLAQMHGSHWRSTHTFEAIEPTVAAERATGGRPPVDLDLMIGLR